MISKKNILNLDARNMIYNFILKNQGLHLREVSRRMKIPISTLKYHLIYLEKEELISTKTEKGYKRYFVIDKLGQTEKDILNLLRQEAPRNIIFKLVFNGVSSQIELSKDLKKNPATISYHLKKLQDMDLITAVKPKNGIVDLWDSRVIIRRSPRCSEILYAIKTRKICALIYKMFIINKQNLADDDFIKKFNLINGIVVDLHSKKKSILAITDVESAIEQVIDCSYDIFPHPYHV